MDVETLLRLPGWEHLTGEERQLVEQNTRRAAFPKGAAVLHSGDCLGLVQVVRGCLRAYLLSEEGREVTIFRVEPGEACVLSATCVMSQITFETNLVAEEETELLILSSGAFGRLTEENLHVRCFLYEMAAERFSEVLWVMQQILFMGFDRRLALYLAGACRRTGSTSLKLTHEQVARDLGSAREVVTRMLRRFAREGLVEVRRGSLLVKDPGALEALGE